ncbi:tRNA (adenosine(37)-N6)-threonylcarbamoyltransferase complex ATPase subunit type 1 TsaE [Flexivirga sp. ID2601S]|uniref:tRNA threonylcarbamoyladenosine biosynthesis protein TsaE n=1 Tax=Flexivirga aerilata TaxID=1656889 RepID=A0A849AJ49_9MICO|nr:tRNA (adenosine(37)-N6)-threonylcarbamoyltransferase complex ATPase subunit type 1 TsaE [Flexivirga aerilata]NNG40013.1 tRNA (adenosine(37)-N6)-threonylcarbamoyltransferase complex ATPase subunit type 1 TsaE [Flexivirga aerilata]
MTVIRLESVDATHAFGERLGRLLRAGDVLVLTGGLGAGKTTLTQGIAAGLGVRGPITSPTFVIARTHPSLVGGPELVHVDAYRLSGAIELDDLDLDASVSDAVTVVEWGAGLAEELADEHLEVVLEAGGDGDGGSDGRTVRLLPTGKRFERLAAELAG